MLLWVTANYGPLLIASECPLLVADRSSTGGNSSSGALAMVGPLIPATVAIAVLASLVVSVLISWVWKVKGVAQNGYITVNGTIGRDGSYYFSLQRTHTSLRWVCYALLMY